MKIYVASSWRNKYQQGIVGGLMLEGHSVYDFRHPAPGDHGFSWKEIDNAWESWGPVDYMQALQSPIAIRGYHKDMEALIMCELVVLVLPSGRSAHAEAGWAAGQGKPVIVYMPEPCEPELMYKMFNAIVTGMDHLVDLLRTPLGAFQSISLSP